MPISNKIFYAKSKIASPLLSQTMLSDRSRRNDQILIFALPSNNFLANNYFPALSSLQFHFTYRNIDSTDSVAANCLIFLQTRGLKRSDDSRLGLSEMIKAEEPEKSQSMPKQAEQTVYREFIRQKYTKYRHQLPRTTEQYIFQKIGKEWEILTEQERADIYKRYCEQGFIQIRTDNQQQSQFNAQKQKSAPTIQHQSRVEPKSQNKLEALDIVVPQTGSRVVGKCKQEPDQPAEIEKDSYESISIKDRDSHSSHSLSEEQQGEYTVLLGQKLSELIKKSTNSPNNNFYRRILGLIDDKQKLQEVKLQKSKESLQHSFTFSDLSIINEEEPLSSSESDLSSELEYKPKNYPKFQSKSKKQEPSKNSPQTRQKKTSEYLKFYQRGYDQLKKTSEKLTNTEITKILVAIWKKEKQEKMEQKKAAKKKETEQKKREIFRMKQQIIGRNKKNQSSMEAFRLQTGRAKFAQAKRKAGFSEKSILICWRMLPKQSKLMWQNPQRLPSAELLNHFKPIVKPTPVRYGPYSSKSLPYFLEWSIFNGLHDDLSPSPT